MKLRLFRLSDRGTFERYLSKTRRPLAAYAFANIAVWRRLFTVRWALVHEALCCFFENGAGCFMYLPPLGDPGEEVLKECFRFMEEKNHNRDISRIENVAPEDLARFGRGPFRHYKKCDEYIVRRKDMVALAGNRYRHQRNLCNYFEKHYQARMRAYRPGDRRAVLDLYDRWAAAKKQKGSDAIYRAMLDDSRQALVVMLGALSSLKVKAVVVECGGRPEAFSSGFLLSGGKFCINFEFADLAFKGIAAYTFREFSRLCGPCEEINIMDAVGLDNIRRTKEMYHPAQTVSNYTVLLKDEACCL
ncbi:MAG: phosphatidylglycerol lysyltransferase domain-containing protein [Candidatus Omnitrophica bacterium]|nr:phosphatidylglycerol lysyltransferase domain-containing protein [Candidatus Omnitrophota bacterium]MDD5137744.1 phosphatidylglycerol lysyltransferase domain-containing protein [Candidatus Omnitrophota bacterium]MDD5538717.1 phosphatidylglycerol lysyltransferase domain-containing protein [Candidatus Omnitrophota bacterium]